MPGFCFGFLFDESGAIRKPCAPHVGGPVQQMFLALMFIVICVTGGAWSLVLHTKIPGAADSIVVYNEPS